MRNRLQLIAAIAIGIACGGCASIADTSNYAVPNTQVSTFTTKDKSRTYELRIGLPRNYDSRSERFPVIYLLDADFSFPLAQTELTHFTDRGQLKEAIIVGIAYPGASADLKLYQRTRTIDYTPVYSPDGGYTAEDQKYSGGGPKFLSVLSDEILPYVDTHYRTDPAARMIVGHSFGGLFATYAMLNRPGLFRDYLIVSPNYVYDNREMFAEAKAYVAKHSTLPAHVFYAVGAYENHPKGDKMVDDLREMDMLLTNAHLQGYTSQLHVFDDETHNSVFPAALTRGLRVLYDFEGEAAGNKLEQQR